MISFFPFLCQLCYQDRSGCVGSEGLWRREQTLRVPGKGLSRMGAGELQRGPAAWKWWSPGA